MKLAFVDRFILFQDCIVLQVNHDYSKTANMNVSLQGPQSAKKIPIDFSGSY